MFSRFLIIYRVYRRFLTLKCCYSVKKIYGNRIQETNYDILCPKFTYTKRLNARKTACEKILSSRIFSHFFIHTRTLQYKKCLKQLYVHLSSSITLISTDIFWKCSTMTLWYLEIYLLHNEKLAMKRRYAIKHSNTLLQRLLYLRNRIQITNTEHN